ncbi:histidine phosphatase family protein [Thermomonospora umbrina]|uniref:2,3-bisphosphoglycerate-dependent phosphoglycerate mutase n=1 Tax=Thermomonospora umbrina TaxID=111806 RepID=A0A3D9SZ78_9ACTN|nr:histidine phosphatase family protein [Thermomonospora umbrina]REE98275.1 2,3-bisphosphoglycerate-dependent phosphoglycerate mutase [Thermomonospora umbrina]
MTLFYLVQHAQKEPGPGDPGLTELGLRQAERTAEWLRGVDPAAVFSSPLRRALRTAEFIADAAGVAVRTDDRLRERMNWDGDQPLDGFLDDWAAAVADRDFVPANGESSRRAGERFRAFLVEHAREAGPIVVCTHGGVTVDLLRTLMGDGALAPELLCLGVPACAITTLRGLSPVSIASMAHLERPAASQ